LGYAFFSRPPVVLTVGELEEERAPQGKFLANITSVGLQSEEEEERSDKKLPRESQKNKAPYELLALSFETKVA